MSEKEKGLIDANKLVQLVSCNFNMANYERERETDSGREIDRETKTGSTLRELQLCNLRGKLTYTREQKERHAHTLEQDRWGREEERFNLTRLLAILNVRERERDSEEWHR